MNPDRVIAVRNDKTVYRDGNACMKVFGASHDKAAIFSEALNQARAEAVGLPVPEVLGVDRFDGKWAITSTYIRGKTLDRLMASEPLHRDTHIARLIELQRRVQRAQAPLMEDLIEKLARRLDESGVEPDTRRALRARLLAMPRRDTICHGDLTPSNIIVAEDGTPYLLDWSHATRGAAEADAAGTYLLLHLSHGASVAEVYLDLYCQTNGNDRNAVLAWMPLVAMARSVKGYAAEQAFLCTWFAGL